MEKCVDATTLQISWVRHRDIHLLTVGRYTYTSDQRFSAHHIPLTHFWQLRIRAVTPRDEGFYECQVAMRESEPSLFRLIYLDVVSEFSFNIQTEFIPKISTWARV